VPDALFFAFYRQKQLFLRGIRFIISLKKYTAGAASDGGKGSAES
jgi:hypothetical protein